MEVCIFVSKTEQKQPLYVQQCKAQEQQDIKCWSVTSAKHTWKYAQNSERLQDGVMLTSPHESFFFLVSLENCKELKKPRFWELNHYPKHIVTVLLTGTIGSIPPEESKGMERKVQPQ